MARFSVVCPHCARTYSIEHYTPVASAATRGRCPSCNKAAQVTFKNSVVVDVRK